MSPDGTLTVSDFFAQWDLYSAPILAAVVVGATLGLLGVYVVLRRLVFLSAALGQAASLGVVVALWVFGAELGTGDMLPIVGAIAFAFVATLIVGRKTAGAYRDGLLGAIFLLGAAGTILVATRIPNEMHDIQALLSGDAVAVLDEDLTLVGWLGGFVLFAHIVGWRGFAAVSFDPQGARVRGVPVRLFEVLLAVTLALGISAGIRVLGPLPVFALSVLPAIAATRLGRNIPESLAIGAVIGMLAGIYGYLAAYLLELPVGTSQTAMALVLAAFVEVALRMPRIGSPRLLARPRSVSPVWAVRAARGIGLGLLVAAVVIALRPIRAGLDAATGGDVLAAPAWEAVLTGLGLIAALPAAWLAWTSRERGVVLPGFVIAWVGALLAAFVWADGAGFVAMGRPLVLATALAALAACCREVAHRLQVERLAASAT